ncbi:LysR family transcriptional regulator [Marinomonas foliarum]|uniref:LysR family transcriptional regulator n=1 Tax=Marinomonas foliarum TaxID=491950 RepID=A0A369AC81_9GAMM|nr:LysR family transcriptional regulator [Marinomonas foliarum]RCX06783.1 LysR family transcriptional regulator [Marinomonas foliarum]
MIYRVNLNLLRSLKVLLEERHVSHAANKLNLTQSAVSRQLSQLRYLFADPLLIREGNTLIPTPKALMLQTKLTHWFLELDDLLVEEAFEPAKWHGEFVLSSSDYVAQYILPDIVEALAAHAPNVSMQYRLWQPDLLPQLATSDIQLASSMSPTQPEGVSSVQIGEDSPVCVMSHAHPLAKQDTLSIDDLLAYAHIKVIGGGDKDSYVDEALAKLEKQRRFALKVPFFYAAAQSLCQSQHLLVIPEHIARNLKKHFSLTYKPLPITTPRHKYWLIWHAKYDNDPSHLWVRNLVLQTMSKATYSIGYDTKS